MLQGQGAAHALSGSSAAAPTPGHRVLAPHGHPHAPCRRAHCTAVWAHPDGGGAAAVDARAPPQRGPVRQRQRTWDPLNASLPASLHELRGGIPRGVVAPIELQQQHSEQQWQPQQQQQQQRLPAAAQAAVALSTAAPPRAAGGPAVAQQLRPPQSLRDKNMSFSGALRQVQGVAALLQLLHNPQWGQALRDLDGVSVVGALVWLSKSSEWAQLQQHGSVGEQQWALRETGDAAIQALLDRAEALVMPAAPTQGGVNNSRNAAAAAIPAPLMRPAELANLIYVTAKLQQQRPRLLAAAAAALATDLYACSNTQLNRLIWGLATARVHPGDGWLLSFCKAAQAKFMEANGSQLTTVVYGVARLRYVPPDVWVAGWLEAALPLLPTLSARNLANAAWGLAVFRFQAPHAWLSAFYEASTPVMGDLAPPGISQLCQGLVVLGGGQPPPPAWRRALLAAAQRQLRDMELLQLCNLGWALAHWQHQPAAALMEAWLDAALALLPAATPVDLAVLLWSCDKLGYVPQQRWLEAWFAAAELALPRCEPLQLSTIAVVLGNWGLVPVRGFSVTFWRVCKARLPDFTPYQLSLLLLGLGKVRRSVPNTWASTVLDTFAGRLLPAADPGDVCRLVGALGRVVVKPGGSAAWLAAQPAAQQQLQQCVAWVLPQLAQVEPPWLVLMVKGLVHLQCHLPPQQVAALNEALTAMDERIAPGHRQVLIQGLQQLRDLARGQPSAAKS